MKNLNLNRTIFAALAAFSVLFAVGCGNDDNKPPEDKNYYTGPMKPKDAGPASDTKGP